MRSFSLLILILCSTRANATGLVIHAAEIGIAKFHRYDNSIHPYSKNNLWVPYTLPSAAGNKTPLVVQNPDKSISIFFSNLEELIRKVVELSTLQKEKVSVLNISAHGLPGGMWFPSNRFEQSSLACLDWSDVALGSDQDNYDKYYSAIPKADILNIRQYSQSWGGAECTTGLDEWTTVLNRVVTFKTSLAPDFTINFFSCVVGLGPLGAYFMNGLGKLLTNSTTAQIKALLNFGLGDWSMPEGMGFWDYQNDTQLNHDNAIYPINRKDREIMQKGEVRVSSASATGTWNSKIVSGESFLNFNLMLKPTSIRSGYEVFQVNPQRPARVRIVGTSVYAPVKK
jgi:hypothetical protein